MATPRVKKSARLLQKLNRSLDGDTTPAAKPAAAGAAAKVTAPPAAAAAEELEVVPPAPADSARTSRAAAEAESPAIETVASPDLDRRTKAEHIVRKYVPFAVGAGLIPLPVVDLAAIGGLQLKMLAALSRHYDVPFTRSQGEAIVTSLLGSVGGTVVASSALGSMAKWFPGVGTLLSLTTLPIASSAVTLAIGRLAIDHFETGGTMENFDLDLAQQAFERKLADAKQALA
jgi:uncharacterized protein (DUF697 family)